MRILRYRDLGALHGRSIALLDVSSCFSGSGQTTRRCGGWSRSGSRKFGEPMALVGIEVRVHSFSRILQDLNHLLCLFLRNADVVFALEDKERSLRVSDIFQRRIRFVDGSVLFRVAQQRFFVLLQTRVFMLKHREPVDDAVGFDGENAAQISGVLPMAISVIKPP